MTYTHCCRDDLHSFSSHDVSSLRFWAGGCEKRQGCVRGLLSVHSFSVHNSRWESWRAFERETQTTPSFDPQQIMTHSALSCSCHGCGGPFTRLMCVIKMVSFPAALCACTLCRLHVVTRLLMSVVRQPCVNSTRILPSAAHLPRPITHPSRHPQPILPASKIGS